MSLFWIAALLAAALMLTVGRALWRSMRPARMRWRHCRRMRRRAMPTPRNRPHAGSHGVQQNRLHHG
ncbi:hypothetical protein B551_0212735 [Cupriavidus sp. HPC(L)]|uniref:hypothetical protein n=1 Tax=Cupriavidus TaxID=106589 RepID=UPI000291A441|nr:MULTISPECIES: hypothetical protein [Cupriavidus]ESJ15812.1 hypothetical protein B551_0212735 [Cupriavidus sp. HPC(L)]